MGAEMIRDGMQHAARSSGVRRCGYISPVCCCKRKVCAHSRIELAGRSPGSIWIIARDDMIHGGRGPWWRYAREGGAQSRSAPASIDPRRCQAPRRQARGVAPMGLCPPRVRIDVAADHGGREDAERLACAHGRGSGLAASGRAGDLVEGCAMNRLSCSHVFDERRRHRGTSGRCETWRGR